MQIIYPDWQTDPQYLEFVADILENEEFMKLHQIEHHHVTTRYNHSLFVSYVSYVIGKKLGADLRSLARGALLHDFFLESRQEIEQMHIGSHNAVHPHLALAKAQSVFELNPIEEDIIVKHMFLCTPRCGIPRYLESRIVTVADKYCSIYEVGKGNPEKWMQWMTVMMIRFKQLNLHFNH
ncbi:HD domain-containing protein [Allofustis seminis]|uniref:HD domain-containing protein n=1 Tax=Allofustis seminis TaxID=166939 RepID=UPI00058F82FD|nr:HD domain-containing protein [Allofustis seminis]